MENNTNNPIDGILREVQQSAKDKVEVWLNRTATITIEELEQDRKKQAEESKREEGEYSRAQEKLEYRNAEFLKQQLQRVNMANQNPSMTNLLNTMKTNRAVTTQNASTSRHQAFQSNNLGSGVNNPGLNSGLILDNNFQAHLQKNQPVSSLQSNLQSTLQSSLQSKLQSVLQSNQQSNLQSSLQTSNIQTLGQKTLNSTLQMSKTLDSNLLPTTLNTTTLTNLNTSTVHNNLNNLPSILISQNNQVNFANAALASLAAGGALTDQNRAILEQQASAAQQLVNNQNILQQDQLLQQLRLNQLNASQAIQTAQRNQVNQNSLTQNIGNNSHNFISGDRNSLPANLINNQISNQISNQINNLHNQHMSNQISGNQQLLTTNQRPNQQNVIPQETLTAAQHLLRLSQTGTATPSGAEIEVDMVPADADALNQQLQTNSTHLVDGSGVIVGTEMIVAESNNQSITQGLDKLREMGVDTTRDTFANIYNQKLREIQNLTNGEGRSERGNSQLALDNRNISQLENKILKNDLETKMLEKQLLESKLLENRLKSPGMDKKSQKLTNQGLMNRNNLETELLESKMLESQILKNKLLENKILENQLLDNNPSSRAANILSQASTTAQLHLLSERNQLEIQNQLERQNQLNRQNQQLQDQLEKSQVERGQADLMSQLDRQSDRQSQHRATPGSVSHVRMQLNQAQLNQAQLNQAQLNQAQLNQAQLSQMSQNQISQNQLSQISQTQLNQAHLNQSQLNQSQFSQSQLSRNQSQLNQSQLNHTQLSQSRLNQSQLNQSQLQQVQNLSNQQLINTTLANNGILTTTSGLNTTLANQTSSSMNNNLNNSNLTSNFNMNISSNLNNSNLTNNLNSSGMTTNEQSSLLNRLNEQQRLQQEQLLLAEVEKQAKLQSQILHGRIGSDQDRLPKTADRFSLRQDSQTKGPLVVSNVVNLSSFSEEQKSYERKEQLQQLQQLANQGRKLNQLQNNQTQNGNQNTQLQSQTQQAQNRNIQNSQNQSFQNSLQNQALQQSEQMQTKIQTQTRFTARNEPNSRSPMLQKSGNGNVGMSQTQMTQNALNQNSLTSPKTSSIQILHAQSLKKMQSLQSHQSLLQKAQSTQNVKSLNKSGINQLSQNQISQNTLSQNQLSQNQLSQNQLSHNKPSQSQISQNTLSQNQLSHNQISQNHLNQNQISQKQLGQNLTQNHLAQHQNPAQQNLAQNKVNRNQSSLHAQLQQLKNEKSPKDLNSISNARSALALQLSRAKNDINQQTVGGNQIRGRSTSIHNPNSIPLSGLQGTFNQPQMSSCPNPGTGSMKESESQQISNNFLTTSNLKRSSASLMTQMATHIPGQSSSSAQHFKAAQEKTEEISNAEEIEFRKIEEMKKKSALQFKNLINVKNLTRADVVSLVENNNKSQQPARPNSGKAPTSKDINNFHTLQAAAMAAQLTKNMSTTEVHGVQNPSSAQNMSTHTNSRNNAGHNNLVGPNGNGPVASGMGLGPGLRVVILKESRNRVGKQLIADMGLKSGNPMLPGGGTSNPIEKVLNEDLQTNNGLWKDLQNGHGLTAANVSLTDPDGGTMRPAHYPKAIIEYFDESGEPVVTQGTKYFIAYLPVIIGRSSDYGKYKSKTDSGNMSNTNSERNFDVTIEVPSKVCSRVHIYLDYDWTTLPEMERPTGSWRIQVQGRNGIFGWFESKMQSGEKQKMVVPEKFYLHQGTSIRLDQLIQEAIRKFYRQDKRVKIQENSIVTFRLPSTKFRIRININPTQEMLRIIYEQNARDLKRFEQSLQAQAQMDNRANQGVHLLNESKHFTNTFPKANAAQERKLMMLINQVQKEIKDYDGMQAENGGNRLTDHDIEQKKNKIEQITMNSYARLVVGADQKVSMEISTEALTKPPKIPALEVEEEGAEKSCHLNNTLVNADGTLVKKPDKSYKQLIYDAINSGVSKQMTLNQIYTYIESNYGYYRLTDQNWKNSIRHNLSLNRIFRKIPRNSEICPELINKGNFWTIENEELTKDAKYKESQTNSANSTGHLGQYIYGQPGPSVTPPLPSTKLNFTGQKQPSSDLVVYVKNRKRNASVALGENNENGSDENKSDCDDKEMQVTNDDVFDSAENQESEHVNVFNLKQGTNLAPDQAERIGNVLSSTNVAIRSALENGILTSPDHHYPVKQVELKSNRRGSDDSKTGTTQKRPFSRSDTPEMIQNSADKMEIGKPGGVVKTGLSNPGVSKPGMNKPVQNKPEISNPGVSKPGPTKPGFAKSGVAKPGVAKPGVIKPGVTKPWIAKPGRSSSTRPLTDTKKPVSQKLSTSDAKINKPASSKSSNSNLGNLQIDEGSNHSSEGAKVVVQTVEVESRQLNKNLPQDKTQNPNKSSNGMPSSKKIKR